MASTHDHCPQCGRTMTKLHAMRGIMRGWLPSVGDEVSWEELRADHAKDCYWYETRGFRAFNNGASAPKGEGTWQ